MPQPEHGGAGNGELRCESESGRLDAYSVLPPIVQRQCDTLPGHQPISFWPIPVHRLEIGLVLAHYPIHDSHLVSVPVLRRPPTPPPTLAAVAATRPTVPVYSSHGSPYCLLLPVPTSSRDAARLWRASPIRHLRQVLACSCSIS